MVCASYEKYEKFINMLDIINILCYNITAYYENWQELTTLVEQIGIDGQTPTEQSFTVTSQLACGESKLWDAFIIDEDDIVIS